MAQSGVDRMAELDRLIKAEEERVPGWKLVAQWLRERQSVPQVYIPRPRKMVRGEVGIYTGLNARERRALYLQRCGRLEQYHREFPNGA